MNQSFDFLNIIKYQDVLAWDIKSFSQKAIDSNYEIVLLKDLLVERNKKIKIFEYPEDEFKILGVNNQTGLFDAYVEKGQKINQPYKKVENGYFAYNPYRINVGSIGLKSEKQAYEYISPAYVVFSCKEKLLPEYLEIFLRTSYFNECIKENTTGSVRQTLSFNNLCNIAIPLPSLEQQKTLIEKYNSRLKQAEENHAKASNLEESIDEYLIKELGIENTNQIKETNKLFQTVEYKKLDIWDLDKQDNKTSLETTRYKILKFSDVCSKITDGTHQTPTYSKEGVVFLSAKDVTTQEISLNNIKYVSKDLHEQLKSRCLPQKGDILLAKNGTTGVAALFDLEQEVSIYVSLALLRPKQNLIFSRFLLFYINSSIAKKQFNASLIGVGVPNLHLSCIRETCIPLPSLAIQSKIVEHITKIKQEIKLLRMDAEAQKELAIIDFEQEVFNPCN